MTATDPRPRLPRTPIRGLAATLAAAYVEDIGAGPPPEDDRALAERHRAGRARLSHLRSAPGVPALFPSCPEQIRAMTEGASVHDDREGRGRPWADGFMPETTREYTPGAWES